MAQRRFIHPSPPYMTPPKNNRCPMESIPVEIVIRIFTVAIEPAKLDKTDPDTTAEDDQSLSFDLGEEHALSVDLEPQEVLTHVCRRWRAIALDMPSLWKYIDFSDGPPFDRSREWIRRTKDYPFDIILVCARVDDLLTDEEEESGLEDEEEFAEYKAGFSSYDLGQVNPVDLPAIRNIILPHVSHWGSFIFIADDRRVMNDMLSALSTAGEASELKTMLLSYDSYPVQEAPRPCTPFGGRAPKLRKLEITLVHLDWSQSSFLHGSSLTSLKATSQTESFRPSFVDFTHALQGCSNLTDLELSNFGPSEDISSWPSSFVIQLPSLNSLSLSNFKTSYLARLLQHLRFPVLRTLVARLFPLANSDALVAALCDSVSLQGLINLHIERARIRDRDAAGRLWTSLKSLRVLRIDQNTMVSGGFRAVWVKKEHFPCVDSLMVSGIEGNGLQGLVSARKGSLPLRRLGIEEGSVVTRDQERWLRQNVPEVAYFTNDRPRFSDWYT